MTVYKHASYLFLKKEKPTLRFYLVFDICLFRRCVYSHLQLPLFAYLQCLGNLLLLLWLLARSNEAVVPLSARSLAICQTMLCVQYFDALALTF